MSAYVGTYTGTIGNTVKRTKYSSNPKDFGDNFSIEATQPTKEIEVVITDNRIYYVGMSGDASAKTQLYKSTDG